MNEKTVQTLTRLNAEFYKRWAEEFSRTRQASWPGWARVLTTWQRRLQLSPGRIAPSILDLGCGNGRFGVYLEDSLDLPFEFRGVDASRTLLEMAQRRVPAAGRGSFSFEALDLVAAPLADLLSDHHFDLIVLFGVFHHIPSSRRRESLLQELKLHLAPGALVAVSFWQFAARDRWRRRIVPWEVYNRLAPEPVDRAQLEDGDYLLAWGELVGAGGVGEASLRYCHFADPEEAGRLVDGSGLEIVESFVSDGETGDLNLYYLLT